MRNFFLPAIFATTLFVSATLLFSVQPMIAKMLLPLLGGAPAVWNTCMVFFQTMLLAGYAYAHYTSAWLGFRRQASLHVLLLVAAGMFLPVAISRDASLVPPSSTNTVFWLLGNLLLIAGLPFFMVSTTSALLQKWFSHTAHPAANDPYFLYSASNLGSLLALLAYPAVIEPFLRLQTQSRLWSAGYALLVSLIAACAMLIWRAKVTHPIVVSASASCPPAPRGACAN